MSFRVFQGHVLSAQGWRMCNADECVWVKIPGAEDVSVQVRSGYPAVILPAFIARFNQLVEKVRDADTACWTLNNDVSTSNHPAGVACDINWQLHPFHAKGTFGNHLAAVRQCLNEFRGMVDWGGDWTNPIDEMHFELAGREGYLDKQGRFVLDVDPGIVKLANDLLAGYLGIYKPGPTSPSALSRTDQYALAVIQAGRKRNISQRGICIALSVPFVESGWKMYANSNVPASLNVPHDAVGSDHDSTGLFQQRQAWGPLSSTMNAELSAGLFYDGGAAGQRGLTDFDYNSNSKTPGQWAQAVQVSAYPDRYQQHWDDAVALYNRLASTDSGDDMANVPQDEWNAVKAAVLRLDGEYSAARRAPSRSFFATDQQWGETPLGFEWNTDGNVWNVTVTWGYLLGVDRCEELVNSVANGGVAPASWAGQLTDAQGHWLADFGQQWCQGLIALRTAMQKSFKAAGVAAPQSAAPQAVVYRDVPAAQPAGDTGDHIAATYRANEALLAADVDKGAADQLVSMLKSKTEGAS